MRLRVTRKTLPIAFVSLFFFSCQYCWMCWQRCVSLFRQKVTQDTCDQCNINFIGQTGKKFSVRNVSLVVIPDECDL